MYLMHKNVKVLDFDLDKNRFCILQPEFMPYGLRGAFKDTNDKMTIDDRMSITMDNRYAFTRYLSSRMLMLSRENAKKILNAYGFSQDQTDHTRAKIAITCRAVSMIDCYWVNIDDGTRWEDIDPKHNSLNEVIMHVALKGSSFSVTENLRTPELTGQGVYAKAWKRDNKTGKTFLMKAPIVNGIEHKIEASVSSILNYFNVNHVVYVLEKFEDKPVSMCFNMATDDLSIVSAEEFSEYCYRNGKDFRQSALSIDAESIYKMCIVDYLISNSDRHNKNWGFFMDNNTGELVGCHPLFDHNNAFDKGDMEDQNGGSSLVFSGVSKREAALYSIKRCSLICKSVVPRSVFLSDRMYESFSERAVELGIYSKKKGFLARGYNLSNDLSMKCF